MIMVVLSRGITQSLCAYVCVSKDSCVHIILRPSQKAGRNLPDYCVFMSNDQCVLYTPHWYMYRANVLTKMTNQFNCEPKSIK